jgi:predicted DNA-binding protein
MVIINLLKLLNINNIIIWREIMKKNISLSLDEELIDRINNVCKVSERTKSWFVKKAIENYFDEIEDAEIALQRFSDSKSEYISEKQLKESLKSKEPV